MKRILANIIFYTGRALYWAWTVAVSLLMLGVAISLARTNPKEVVWSILGLIGVCVAVFLAILLDEWCDRNRK